MVALIRAPLLGESAGLLSWVIILGITLAGWRLAWGALNRFGTRVAFWV